MTSDSDEKQRKKSETKNLCKIKVHEEEDIKYNNKSYCKKKTEKQTYDYLEISL